MSERVTDPDVVATLIELQRRAESAESKLAAALAEVERVRDEEADKVCAFMKILGPVTVAEK